MDNFDYLYIGLLIRDQNGFREVKSDGCNNYRRVEMNPMDWIVADNHQVAFSCSIVQFPKATDIWGYIKYFGIYNEKQGGDLLMVGEISQAMYIKAGVVPELKNIQVDLKQLGLEIENG